MSPVFSFPRTPTAYSPAYSAYSPGLSTGDQEAVLTLAVP